MPTTPFSALADLAQALEATSSRIQMAGRIGAFLKRLEADEIAPAVRLLLGQVFPAGDPRALNMSWASVMAVVDQLASPSQEERRAIGTEAVDGGEFVRLLLERARNQPPRPPEPSLLEVYGTLEAIAAVGGAGSHRRKASLLRALLERMGPVEAKVLVKDIFGEVRHGAGEGVLLDAVARLTGIEAGLLRRAHMLWGDLAEVASVALASGRAGLADGGIRLFRPLRPMLAQTADTMEEALRLLNGDLALEYKLDGARVQIHRDGPEVRIYSRHLSDVTESLPEVVDAVRAWPGARQAVLEGEVIAVDAEGRPLPFQEVMRRFRRRHDVADAAAMVPVRLYLFDALLLDGRTLVDLPYAERWSLLERAAPPLATAPRLKPADLAAARAFAAQAASEGHEGVMAKALGSPYTPGVRGRAWLKLKHVLSLDLAIVAADWGYGRRHGWLSNYHLAVRDEATGEFALVGKTFKGLTDDEFAAMTQRLLALEVSRHRGTVQVRPEVVVEVVFNEVQASPQYRSGFALRFARISRLREDKGPGEVDTLATLRAIYERQFAAKGRLAAAEEQKG
ncbi:MAG: ATP-dependent DNA ligase [Anaerolineae bacterium]|nr:ATP-dependent DNA ligase [Anaerolineae bacterium]